MRQLEITPRAVQDRIRRALEILRHRLRTVRPGIGVAGGPGLLDGRPWAGAEVVASHPVDVRSAVTDRRGEAVFTGVPRGVWELPLPMARQDPGRARRRVLHDFCCVELPEDGEGEALLGEAPPRGPLRVEVVGPEVPVGSTVDIVLRSPLREVRAWASYSEGIVYRQLPRGPPDLLLRSGSSPWILRYDIVDSPEAEALVRIRVGPYSISGDAPAGCGLGLRRIRAARRGSRVAAECWLTPFGDVDLQGMTEGVYDLTFLDDHDVPIPAPDLVVTLDETVMYPDRSCARNEPEPDPAPWSKPLPLCWWSPRPRLPGEDPDGFRNPAATDPTLQMEALVNPALARKRDPGLSVGDGLARRRP